MSAAAPPNSPASPTADLAADPAPSHTRQRHSWPTESSQGEFVNGLVGAQAAEGGASSPPAQDALGRAAEWITSGLEAAGIAAILLGVLATTAVFLRDGLRAGGGAWEDAYERYRADLGRAILLGLELLVAADIVGTVAAPLDLRSVAALGVIVLIRTFLSFSLEVEIKGRLPWQKAGERPGRASPSGDAGS